MTTPQHGPPASNPILSHYESFERETPFVTRHIIKSLTLSYFISYFFDLTWPLKNSPIFTLGRFELYRIILSPFVCDSLMLLVFSYFSFLRHGKPLEHMMGSTGFAMLVLTIGVLTNIIYIILCLSACLLTSNILYLAGSSVGIWIILLGLISLECSSTTAPSHQNLFMWKIPTLYYPIALLVFFVVFSGESSLVPYIISVGVGYAYGFGKLDRLKLGATRRKRWEKTLLRKFTTMAGWVAGPTGNELVVQSGDAIQTPVATIASLPAKMKNNVSDSVTNSFSGQGHTLGKPAKRSGSSDRALALAAAEKRCILSEKVEENDEEKGTG